MKLEEVEQIAWKTLTEAMARAARAAEEGLAAPRASADDVDLIMAAVDAYAATIRRRHNPGKRAVHYAPMPAIKTACGILVAPERLLRITGMPASAECENCKLTERWKHDMAFDARVYG